jgi:hypothetical protein
MNSKKIGRSYPNMVHIMWNNMLQYTFNFHKDWKSFKLFMKYICVFEYTILVKNLLKCKHSICNYMWLLVICNYIYIFRYLLNILCPYYKFTQTILLYFIKWFKMIFINISIMLYYIIYIYVIKNEVDFVSLWFCSFWLFGEPCGG